MWKINVQNSNFLESVVQWWCENQNLKSSDRFPQKKNWEFLWWYVSCESSTCLGMEQLKQRDKPNVPFGAIFLRALHGTERKRKNNFLFLKKRHCVFFPQKNYSSNAKHETRVSRGWLSTSVSAGMSLMFFERKNPSFFIFLQKIGFEDVITMNL